MRLYPIAGSIDTLSVDTGDGGVEHLLYRTYAAVDDAEKIDMGGDAKRVALTAFLAAMDFDCETRRPDLSHPGTGLGYCESQFPCADYGG